MAIKKFNVERYNTQGALLGSVVCPAEFSAEIEGTETMEELVAEAVRNIPSSDYQERKRLGRDGGVWAAFDGINTRIPYDNKGVDEKNGVAGFVLLNEFRVVGGMNVKEGIYGIIRDGTTLRGKLLEYDSGKLLEYEPIDARDNNYFRHLVDRVEEGILKGKVLSGESERDFSYDLKEL